MSQVMPPLAVQWNNLFNFAAIIALTALAVVMVSMVVFTVRWRERKGKPYSPPKGAGRSRGRDAVIFAIISIVLLFTVAVASETLVPNARFQPNASQSLVIGVTAFQWNFRFNYPDGMSSIGEVYLPENTTVMFEVTSSDVMHNFFLVQYDTSIDAIPGRTNVIWITTPSLNGATQLTYTIECKELCGVGHTYMVASMFIVTQSYYNQWLSGTAQNATATGGV